MHAVSTNQIADILHFNDKMLHEHLNSYQIYKDKRKELTVKNRIVAYRKCCESCQKHL